MAIFVDAIQQYRSGEWCHMWNDGDADELHQFAQKIGLRREWAQIKKDFIIPVHYDLRPGKRMLALKLGAVEKPVAEYMREVQDRKLSPVMQAVNAIRVQTQAEGYCDICEGKLFADGSCSNWDCSNSDM
jgi:hypothetical protein